MELIDLFRMPIETKKRNRIGNLITNEGRIYIGNNGKSCHIQLAKDITGIVVDKQLKSCCIVENNITGESYLYFGSGLDTRLKEVANIKFNDGSNIKRTHDFVIGNNAIANKIYLYLEGKEYTAIADKSQHETYRFTLKKTKVDSPDFVAFTIHRFEQ